MLNTLKTCIFQLNMFQYFRILKASIIGQNFIIKLFNLIQIVPNIDKFLDISGDSPSLHLQTLDTDSGGLRQINLLQLEVEIRDG